MTKNVFRFCQKIVEIQHFVARVVAMDSRWKHIACTFEAFSFYQCYVMCLYDGVFTKNLKFCILPVLTYSMFSSVIATLNISQQAFWIAKGL